MNILPKKLYILDIVLSNRGLKCISQILLQKIIVDLCQFIKNKHYESI